MLMMITDRIVPLKWVELISFQMTIDGTDPVQYWEKDDGGDADHGVDEIGAASSSKLDHPSPNESKRGNVPLS